MSLVPCSACGSRPRGKLIWTAWAWRLADNTRVAYKTTLCVPCFAQHVVPLTIATDECEGLSCIACHADCTNDLDPIYMTIAAPGAGKESYEMPYDAACAVQLRAWIGEHGQRLEDRAEFGGLGPQTTLSATAVWASLGIRPRE